MCNPHKQVYKHDCDACVFLGHYYGVDMYFCYKYRNTLLFRFNDNPSDYSSYPYSTHYTVLVALLNALSGDEYVEPLLTQYKRLAFGRFLADARGLQPANVLTHLVIEGGNQ